MNIDRNNYEEYFILYWDNELPEDQKRQVEQFVNQTPNLQEEFNLLRQSHFTPDETISLANKEFLFKEEIPATRELLLSYMDNELGETEKSAIEAYISINPDARHELSLLEKTRLHPDKTIVFPDKTILYRSEQKTPVVKMVWFRVAAAAAIILVAGFITMQITSSSAGADRIALAQAGKIIINAEPRLKDPITKQPGQDLPSIAHKKENVAGNKTAPVLAVKTKKTVIQTQEDPSSLYVNNGEQEKGLTPPDKRPNETIDVVESKNDKLNFSKSTVTLKSAPALDIHENSNNAHYASNNEDPSPGSKGGIRGLLRKATRVFERRTNIPATTEDNKLLVGAFAVSLK